MSLRLRLSVTLTCVLFMTVMLGMTYLIINARQTISDELRSSVEMSSKLIALMLNHVPPSSAAAITEQMGSQFAMAGDMRHLRISVTADTSYSGVQAELPSPSGVPNWFVRLVHPEPLQLVRVIRLGDGLERIVLRADAADEIGESWRELWPLMLILAAFGIFANCLIYFVLGSALRSLRSVSTAFQAIEAGNFDGQVPQVGVSDIDLIIDRFNHMCRVLKRSNDETQLLSQRSLAIQEDERRQLAQELHDDLGQSISAIKALAVSIRDRRPALADTVISNAETIVDVSTDIYARVRRMMAHLRPPVLAELGLVSALQNMIDEWNSHHEDTFCQFRADSQVPKLSDSVAINCYRIVQEALTNIAKHAGASQAAIRLWISNEGSDITMLHIQIDDDGAGFDANAVTRGLGLVGLHERVEAMNGEIDFTTAPQCGTHIQVLVPCE